MKRSLWFGQLEVDPALQNVEREILLWRAVIDQAIEDFLNTNTDKESRMLRLQAKVWLFDSNADLEEVCYMAQLTPAMVRNKAITVKENTNARTSGSQD